MNLDLNDGTRPSRFELALRATGELPSTSESEAFARGLPPPPEFDWVALQAASHRLADRKPARAPARSRAWAFAPLLALAAGMLFAVRMPGVRPKGDADLDFYVLRDGEVKPGLESERFRAGDALQFTYRTAGLDSLVLLSVDGRGKLTVFYPASGEEPVPIIPGERHVLDGSVVLDDAPGPELFVAVFGPGSVQEARELVAGAWARGGGAAVAELARQDGAVDVVRIPK